MMDSALSNANNIGHVYYFIIIPIGIIAYAVYMFFRLKGDRRRKQDWLTAHPNAAKVYIGKNNSILKKLMHKIQVISVDGEKPIFFTEKMVNGFFVAPGTHVVESSFSKTRPGFFYRSVTTTYRPSKQEITAQTGKSYNYTFDTESESYRFEELGI